MNSFAVKLFITTKEISFLAVTSCFLNHTRRSSLLLFYRVELLLCFKILCCFFRVQTTFYVLFFHLRNTCTGHFNSQLHEETLHLHHTLKLRHMQSPMTLRPNEELVTAVVKGLSRICCCLSDVTRRVSKGASTVADSASCCRHLSFHHNLSLELSRD